MTVKTDDITKGRKDADLHGWLQAVQGRMGLEVQLIKNTQKQTKFEDKAVKSTQPSLVLIGHHDFLIFSNRRMVEA